MFLVDTNIWLELLLEQEKAEEVKNFLQNRESRELAITEFSLYSIGIILNKFGKIAVFKDFITDTIIKSSVNRICLNANQLKSCADTMKKFSLDFDDSYQYVAAIHYNCTLVSFDSDFDGTDLIREIPTKYLK
jgi:predicted nucleic acid-binding protein